MTTSPTHSVARSFPCRCGGTYTELWCDHAMLVSMPVSCSSFCKTCGHVAEADGDTLPDSVREAILRDGLWALIVPGTARARILTTLREELGLAFSEIHARLRTDDPIATGTHGEMTRLLLTLAKRGVEPGEVRLLERR